MSQQATSLGASSSSTSPSLPFAKPQGARRSRKTLSCSNCKDRKIKCDRLVPRCSSCVSRGIERTCRWGDERDEITPRTDALLSGNTKKSRAAHNVYHNTHGGKKHSFALSDDDDNQSGADRTIDSIVGAVIKRLRKNEDENISSSSIFRRQSQSTNAARDETSNDDEDERGSTRHRHLPSSLDCISNILNRNLKPHPPTNAFVLPITAFSGSYVNHVFFMRSAEPDQELDAALIRRTLQNLPSKTVCDKLLDFFLRDMQPFLNVFNIPILLRQYDEFWSGMEELGIVPNDDLRLRPGHSLAELPHVDPLHPLSGMAHIASAHPKGGRSYFLCSRVRQGLIAVILAIFDIATRSVSLERLISIGILSHDATEDLAVEWSERINELSLYHLSLSNYYQQPTLWTIQALYLNQGRWMDIRTLGRSLGSRGVLVSIAVSMGLNKLGSAYDDLEKMEDTPQTVTANSAGLSSAPGATAKPCAALEPEPAQFATGKTNFLADPRYSTTVGVFEEGQLALRELGRKIWCSIVILEWIISSHIDQFYCAHDTVCFTSPPLPIDDDDILSQRAPLLIAKARLGLHKPSSNEPIAYALALARAVRTQVDLENVKGTPLSYDDILMVDAQMQHIVHNVPPSLQVEHCREKAAAHMSAKRADLDDKSSYRIRFLMFESAFLQDQLYFRRLRLHRQYFGQGLKDTRYRTSVIACLDAARIIVEVRWITDPYDLDIFASFVMQSHLFHALLVLQLSLLYEMDRRRDLRLAEEGLHAGKGTASAAAAAARSANEPNAYVLDDFDATLEQLQRALMMMHKGKQTKFKQLLPEIGKFVQGVKEFQDAQAQKYGGKHPMSISSKRRKDHLMRTSSTNNGGVHDRDHDSHTDAATILASIPSMAQTPPISWPSVSSTSSTSQQGQTGNTSDSSVWQAPYDQQQQDHHHQTTTTTFDAFDPGFWSLEALFPDYAEGQVDLLEALEKSFLAAGNNDQGGGAVVPTASHQAPQQQHSTTTTNFPNSPSTMTNNFFPRWANPSS